VLGKEIHALLNQVADNVSRISLEAHLLAEFHILRCITQGKPLPTIDKTFCDRCFVALTDSEDKCLDEVLWESVEVYRAIRPEGFQIPTNKYMKGPKDNLSVEMVTSFKNHIALNFTARLERYIRKKHGMNREAAHRFAKGTFRPVVQ
jgi:hypothetical protein